eukprot:CAMPEP_0184749870 /NCGR_PEP_ID=MMETSP0315-20130426/31685_1 /TAXON_ID=101924 /ORGANISM="Rhodosorus marinus, Strain UTEX LB 2760" /LENGTH=52 /DNA_ID=CAMNT_0027227399 /DNA_START=104 /DNA_END=258 /DNA_ORIENTATION=-
MLATPVSIELGDPHAWARQQPWESFDLSAELFLAEAWKYEGKCYHKGIFDLP